MSTASSASSSASIATTAIAATDAYIQAAAASVSPLPPPSTSSFAPSADDTAATSAASLHALSVWPLVLSTSSSFAAAVSAHLVLVYTGTPRLAKRLLQSVLRRWHARTPDAVALVDELCTNAVRAARAVQGAAAVSSRVERVQCFNVGVSSVLFSYSARVLL